MTSDSKEQPKLIWLNNLMPLYPRKTPHLLISQL